MAERSRILRTLCQCKGTVKALIALQKTRESLWERLKLIYVTIHLRWQRTCVLTSNFWATWLRNLNAWAQHWPGMWGRFWTVGTIFEPVADSYRINSCKGRTFCPEIWQGQIVPYTGPNLLVRFLVSAATRWLSSSSGTQKYTACKNLPMRTHSIAAPNAHACFSIGIFFSPNFWLQSWKCSPYRVVRNFNLPQTTLPGFRYWKESCFWPVNILKFLSALDHWTFQSTSICHQLRWMLSFPFLHTN